MRRNADRRQGRENGGRRLSVCRSSERTIIRSIIVAVSERVSFVRESKGEITFVVLVAVALEWFGSQIALRNTP